MADALLGFVAHPLAVVAHVFGETLARPSNPAATPIFSLRDSGFTGGLPGKLRRNLDHRLVDQHRDRVEVAGVSSPAQAAALPAVSIHRPRTDRETREACAGRIIPWRADDPRSRHRSPRQLCQISSRARCRTVFVSRVLPQHEILDDLEKPLPLFLLRLLRLENIRMRRWIVHHLRENHRPRRRQRPPRPPQMQRRRMPMPNRLLPRRCLVDGFQRQSDFDEFFLIVQ